MREQAPNPTPGVEALSDPGHDWFPASSSGGFEDVPQTWHLTAAGMTSREASIDELRDLLAQTQGAKNAGDQRTYVVWTSGLWSWEPLVQLPRLLDALAARQPPPATESPEGSFGERFLATAKKIVGETWNDFRQRTTKKGFFGQIWWFLVVQLVPVVGWVINKGWRLDLIRTGQDEGWPDRMHIGRHFAEGMFLWAMYLLYLLPQFLLLTLIGFDWVEDVVNLVLWALQNLTTGSSTLSFHQILGGSVATFILDSLVLAVYPMVAWPFYRGAMIRYALSGQANVFWRPLDNWHFIKADLYVLLVLYVLQKALWVLSVVLGSILLFTGFLAPLIPLVLAPARLTLSGLLYQRVTRQRYPLAQFFPSEASAISLA
jgi:hypothetical protein